MGLHRRIGHLTDMIHQRFDLFPLFQIGIP